MHYVIWLLSLCSLTLILTEGNIFASPRSWLAAKTKWSLWECSMCMGFWVGVVGHVLAPCPDFAFLSWYSRIFFAGWSVSGGSYLLYKAIAQWSPEP